ncbi:MAG TPA: cupin domain-containing protein [Rubrobacteraceae bacterium]|nr:cupin domain-containing protein [Rubrobacteraceae bacterium]
MPAFWINLEAAAVSTEMEEGAVWILEASRDLNANLIRFGVGRGVEEHVNGEVDVIFVGVAGSGFVESEGEEHSLGAGTLVFVPKGTPRSTRSTSEDFAYLTVHVRRGPLRVRRRT